jgi:putative photosynthetic complex assembly protein
MAGDSGTQHSFPRGPLLGLAAVLGLAVCFATFSTMTGVGRVEAQSAASSNATSRDLFFYDRDDGGVTVADANGGAVIAQFEPATNGFLRSTVRGLVRERKRRELGPETPFRISMEPDGRLLLTDPATNRTVDLRAFGPTNLDVFARLLPDRAVAALR